MKLVVERHTSHVLAGNPLGDPTTRDVWVLLPEEAGAANRSYPTLYCLSGFAGTGEQQVVGTPWAPGLATRLERLFAAGCPPAVVVLPDCFTAMGGSQYRNSPALGRYEDYLCDELVPFVDERFPTLRAREHRGVFGRSSGGYGALCLAMHRPDLFSAIACHSGDMGFAFVYPPDFARTAAALQRAGSVRAWRARFAASEKKRSEDFAVANILAMAAAYSPNPSSPDGFELPFDVATAELLPQVWARWREQDPLNMIEDASHQRALRGLALAFFDCGARDEYFLHLGQRQLTRRLTELGIAHEAEEFDDGHRSLSYRYEVSLPKLCRALTPK